MADNRNWDKELSKIDSLIGKLPAETDEHPAAPTGAGHGLPAGSQPAQPVGAAHPQVPADAGATVRPSRLARAGVWLLAAVSVAAAVSLPFWPFAARCGAELFVYMAAVAGTGLLGLWTSVRSWKMRAPRAHVAGLLVLAWAASLTALEIMPRAGLALPTPERPAVWGCGG